MFDKLPMVRPSPALVALDIAIAATFTALAIIWVALVRARTQNRAAVIFHGVFAAYLVILACILFLPLHGIRAAADSFEGTRPLHRAWYWGLRPHNPMAAGHLHWQRVANVILTIPFGFGFGLLAPRLGVRRIFASCLAWAMSLELIQLSISVLLGFVYRAFDVNDIIDNALGAWIGLGIFVTLALIVKDTGFGRQVPVTTISGFLRDSVNNYFTAHHTRRGSESDVESRIPE